MNIFDRAERDFTGYDIPDTSFESSWIYLCGDSGAGKSTIARWYEKQWGGIGYVSCTKVIEELARLASRRDKTEFFKLKRRLHTMERIFLDDWGSEPISIQKVSGLVIDPVDIFTTIVFNRYEDRLITGFTSNWLIDKSLKERYDEKVVRRVKELSTVYHFDGAWGSKGGVKIERIDSPRCKDVRDFKLFPNADRKKAQRKMSREQALEHIASLPEDLRPVTERRYREMGWI